MKNRKNKSLREIKDYDDQDTTALINVKKPLKFSTLGLKLPDQPPTQVVSIRLPTLLLNEVKAISSAQDVPYQALIKLWLASAVKKLKSRRRLA